MSEDQSDETNDTSQGDELRELVHQGMEHVHERMESLERLHASLVIACAEVIATTEALIGYITKDMTEDEKQILVKMINDQFMSSLQYIQKFTEDEKNKAAQEDVQ